MNKRMRRKRLKKQLMVLIKEFSGRVPESWIDVLKESIHGKE
jgi:hypothetical protein